MSVIANTPKPPYFAVIFTSTRTEGDNGYGKMADRMVGKSLKYSKGFQNPCHSKTFNSKGLLHRPSQPLSLISRL